VRNRILREIATQGHSRSFILRPTRGSISSYNITGLISEVSEEVATQIAKIAVVNNPTLIWSPRQEEPLRVSAYALYFQKLHRGPLKKCHFYFYDNFGKCGPISIILSLLDSQINCGITFMLVKVQIFSYSFWLLLHLSN